MDTGLSYKFEIGRLVIGWAFVAQSRVKATAVIESLDVLKDTLSSMEAGRISLMKYQLLLQTAKETFNWGIVPTIALAAHAASHAVFGQQLLKVAAGVL